MGYLSSRGWNDEKITVLSMTILMVLLFFSCEGIGLSVTPTTSSLSPSTIKPSLNVTTIASIAVAGILLAIIIASVVILALRQCNCKRRFQLACTGCKDKEEESPPPLPDHFPELIEDYVVFNIVAATTPSRANVGSIEMQNMQQQQQQRYDSHTTSRPVVQLSTAGDKGRKFVAKNPIYVSMDDVEKNADRCRHLGSVPSPDMLSGSQLCISADPIRLNKALPNRRPLPPDLIPVYSESSIYPGAFKSPGRRPPPVPPAVEQTHVEEASGSIKDEIITEEEYDDSLPCCSIYADPQPLLHSEGPTEVTPHNIREIKSLGVGQFGQVLLADTIGLSRKDLGLSFTDDDRTGPVQVAVKRLKAEGQPHVKEAFEKEIKFMSRLRNKNVVRLLGVCPGAEDMFIVMEYMENGDLNQFLHRHKLAKTEKTTPSRKHGLTVRQLTHICVQIASGMKYLASFKFIHRDLATRNCLVGENLNIKIADFGMSCGLYSLDYYRISGRAMLPIRWMANECFYGKFSEKTDVWAFGVTMWEVFTFSREQPYHNMSDQEVIDDAFKGPDRLLLSRPEACPVEVYEVMKRCWIDNVEERIRFRQAHTSLEALGTILESY